MKMTHVALFWLNLKWEHGLPGMHGESTSLLAKLQKWIQLFRSLSWKDLDKICKYPHRSYLGDAK